MYCSVLLNDIDENIGESCDKYFRKNGIRNKERNTYILLCMAAATVCILHEGLCEVKILLYKMMSQSDFSAEIPCN